MTRIPLDTTQRLFLVFHQAPSGWAARLEADPGIGKSLTTAVEEHLLIAWPGGFVRLVDGHAMLESGPGEVAVRLDQGPHLATVQLDSERAQVQLQEAASWTENGQPHLSLRRPVS